MSITYEQCRADKVDDLIRFIDTHWRKNHILTKHRHLLDWQYKNRRGDYNFILATNEKEEVLGIFGYIPTSQFSTTLVENNDVWLAIWKVRDDCKIPGLGIGMLNHARKTLQVECFCALGLSDIVIPIYKALNFTVGILDHYIAFSTTKESFGFVVPVDIPKAVLATSNLCNVEMSQSSLEKLSDEECTVLFSGYPEKDVDYLINRYIRHPVYKYKMLGFNEPGRSIQTIIIVRIIDVESVKIARIVDAFGQSFLSGQYNECFYSWLNEVDCEYIDCMAHGLNVDDMDNSCFSNVKDNQALVVPNYFEPLVHSNVTLDFAYKTNRDGAFRIFKGDSDQDRPNIL